jgi:hypothetical protein
VSIINLISAVAAAIAAIGALIGLRYARQSARAARDATAIGRGSLEVAQATVRLADDARRDAERDRERHRLEHIGELIEKLFWVATLEPSGTADDQFRATMNVLAQALAGSEASLPDSALALQAANAGYVKDSASKARWEIRDRLRAIESVSATGPG